MNSYLFSPRCVESYCPPHPKELATVLSRVKNGQYHPRRRCRRHRHSPSAPLTLSSTPLVQPTEESNTDLYTDRLKQMLAKKRSELGKQYSPEMVEGVRQQIVNSDYWRLEASLYSQALQRRRRRRLHVIRETITCRRYWETEQSYFRLQAKELLRKWKMTSDDISKSNPKAASSRCTPPPVKVGPKTSPTEADAPISSRLRNSRHLVAV